MENAIHVTYHLQRQLGLHTGLDVYNIHLDNSRSFLDRWLLIAVSSKRLSFVFQHSMQWSTTQGHRHRHHPRSLSHLLPDASSILSHGIHIA